MEFFTTTQYTADSDASSSSSASPTLDNRSLSPSLASTYNAGSETADVFRAVVKCRKSWKTLKGGKVVWPLHLEAALLEGLSLYQPDNSRETLLLGRFPMRNRFISEHIFRTTGEVRTAKQVGSRLQQLRDTCGGGRKLQKLLSPVLNSGSTVSNRSHYSLRRYASRSASSSAPTSPVSTEEVDLAWNSIPSSSTVMYIDILDEGEASSPVAREFSDDVDLAGSLDAPRASLHGPRPIRIIKPCLAFISSSFGSSQAILAHSRFTVHHRDAVYEDSSPLTVASNHGSMPVPEGAVVYSCDLVPNYWNMICHSSDPTEFTIHHNIVQGSSPDMSATLFSATYKFRYMPEKVHSPPTSFTTVNSGITSYQEVNREYNGQECFNAGNISEMSSSYDSKNWQDGFGTLSLTELRGYTSLPTTPGWDEYGSTSVDGSCSNSSSPTTANFPHHSQFYPSH